MSVGDEWRWRGRLFDDDADLYDRMRPPYPDAMFDDLAALTGAGIDADVLEIGCGTGQATAGLADRGWRVTAVEPGVRLAEVAGRRLDGTGAVTIEVSPFETWDDAGRRFDLAVAASSWHWVDPSVGWRRIHAALRPGGWFAILGRVVVRRDGEPEVYAHTADLHEQFAPGVPEWGHPPTEAEAMAEPTPWGPLDVDRDGLFDAPAVRWYEVVQELDGEGFVDMLRTQSLYRQLPSSQREPLLDAIADRIRTEMGDRAVRRYLGVLRAARRREGTGSRSPDLSA